MAPTKNSHSNCNNNTGQYTPNSSNNSSDQNNSAGNSSNAGPVNSSGSTGHTHKRHTGTVPKATAPVQRMEREGAGQISKTMSGATVASSVGVTGSHKTGKSSTKRSAASLLQQQKQLQQQQPLAHGIFATDRSGPYNIVTSTQQQQQQQQIQQQHQQQQQQQQQHQRKNTEIVAPIRRELKDLNDYLLSAVATTNNSSQQQIHAQQQHQLKQHNYSKCQQPQHQQQQQQQHQLNENNTTTSGSIDIESITDSQSRFCYPVRPIPRRNLQQNDSTNDYSYSTAATTSNLNQLNHPAAVGVVIPTTPNIVHNSNASSSINDEIVSNNHLTETPTRNNCNNTTNTNINNNSSINQQQLLLLQQLQHQIEEQSSLLLAASSLQQQQQQQQPRSPNLLDIATSSLTASTSNTQATPAHAADASNDINLLQRLQLIQQILSLSAKPNLAAVPAVQTSATVPTQPQSNKATNMVNEVRSPTATERDIIVNSNSLEDVALSEISDNRAQSIQSLHSGHEETPTPDTAPGYEELQQRLEASNRNIHNLQEQQQQLLRLQTQAKQHLSEMEALRHQAPTLSFGQQNGGNANDAPEYQSIEQVHSDMSALVGRMKNLTTFIQHQNDLGNLLGDDGPDILAEQEALQHKLESLRVQRDEMRNLVGELQDINRNAERTAEQRRQEGEQELRQEEQPVLPTDTTTTIPPATASTAHRVVPVEYSRIVPIELLQAATAQLPGNEAVEDPADSEMIRQKVADIAAMKAQLKRLKDMMATVNLIEEHTASRPDPKEIGCNTDTNSAVNIPVQRERSSSYDRDRTPTASDSNENNNDFMSAKVRMLNEVTSDLRTQALNLQAERDRIKALKEEIVRRKAEAAAAAQVNEDALKRNTTQLMQRRQEEEQSARDILKEEYEAKKKEFEQLCQRLQLDNVCHSSTPTTAQRSRTNGTQDIVSEADDEAEVEEELNDSDFGTNATTANTNKYFTAQSCNSQQSTAKQAAATVTSSAAATHQRNDKHIREGSSSITAPVNTTHDTAASLEAASIQSGSSQSFSMPPPMQHLSGPTTSSWLPGPIPPPLPSSWNPHLYYGAAGSQPFATQFTPPHFAGMPGSVVSGLHSQHHPPAPSSADCICSASNSASTLGATVNATASATSGNSAAITADPMLLQQFVQTQQMLINSVCQCNQMLWHQQREIDTLNNTIHMLQERLLALGGPSSADLAFNIRAESVPPPTSLSGALHNNNVYTSLQNRAQSEQPTGFLPLPRGSAFSNYHQQHQHLYQQRHQQRCAGGYNYATEMQQHQQQNASSSASIFTTLNNAAPPPPPQFNNEAPQSPLTTAGPGPIFMHHHNNTIHQNNANLRTQNQHVNNLQQQTQQQQQPHSNISVNGGSSTLNNQVPPGNRANNYWDNFRSYSRQNLLSTNSNKSNEDQNQQHMQQQQLQQQQYQTPHILPLPELPSVEQQMPQHLFSQRQINQQNSSSNDCNNLNYDRNNSGNSNNNNTNCNKYLRSIQRSRINQLQQQQQQQLVAANMLSNANNAYQANVPSSAARELLENLNWHNNIALDDDSNVFDNYNITGDNDMTAETYANMARNMNMNMNLNFGNMQYQRNKVAAKPACQGATMHRVNLQHAGQLLPYLNIGENQPFDLLRGGGATTSSPAQQPSQTVTAAAVAPSGATTSSSARNRERDFLLCTVDMAAGYNYDPTTAVTDVFATENTLSNANVDEDTTSEEIKRNLLVNALKNDKFTTKFYESIKEDVFRRLESLLLEKDTTELANSSSGSAQQPCLVDDIDNASRYPSRKSYLNAQMGNQQQQQQQLQQHHQTVQYEEHSSHIANEQQQLEPSSQQIKQELVTVETYSDSNNIEEAESNNADETESNNADDNDLSTISQPTAVAENVCAVASRLENEEPEENENLCHNLGAAATSLTNSTIIHSSNVTSNELHPAANRVTIPSEQQQSSVATDNSSSNTKKRKNQRQQRHNASYVTFNMDTNTLALEEVQNRAMNSSHNNFNKLYDNESPDTDLVNYIITRIHNQTPANTIINDTLLVEIAKLTAAAVTISATKNHNGASTSAEAAGNATALQQQQQLIISPKKLYAKIRKKSIPRQRDEFLAWYQGYLEGFLFVNNQNQNNNNSASSKQTAIEKRLPQRQKQQQQLAVECKLVNTNTNATKQQFKIQNCSTAPSTANPVGHNNVNNDNIQVNVDNLDVNDADLAEADQICSANTSSNASNTLPHGEDIDHMHFVDDSEITVAVSNDNQVDELENNENPEEEGAAACCILLEKHDVTAEENLLKDENNVGSIIVTTTAATTTSTAITINDFNINAQEFATMTTSSNSDNTEDTSGHVGSGGGRAKKSKQDFHKRNSVA